MAAQDVLEAQERFEFPEVKKAAALVEAEAEAEAALALAAETVKTGGKR